MKLYELVVVFAGTLSEADVTKAIDNLKKLFDKAEAKITNESKWGHMRLAYPIGKEDKGHFYLWHLSMEPSQAPELQKELRVADKVIRYLMINKPKHDKKFDTPIFDEMDDRRPGYDKNAAKAAKAKRDANKGNKATPTKEAKTVSEKPKAKETKKVTSDKTPENLDDKLDEILGEKV